MKASYFSHDADSRNDEKIISLIMAHGYEGYGIFWAVVEMLRGATGYKLQLDCKRIAFALRADEKKVESVICDFDLFVCKNGLHEKKEKLFYSKSLNRRMKLKDEISEKRKNAAMARWSGQTSAMQMHSKSKADAEQVQCNKSKESKGKELSKEKKESLADAIRVAEYFLNCITAHKPNFKRPNIDSWSAELERAIRIDGRSPREICEVAKWATQDPFWQSNILSAKKLRAQFDQLQSKMQQPGNKTMDQHADEWLALAED